MYLHHIYLQVITGDVKMEFADQDWDLRRSRGDVLISLYSTHLFNSLSR